MKKYLITFFLISTSYVLPMNLIPESKKQEINTEFMEALVRQNADAGLTLFEKLDDLRNTYPNEMQWILDRINLMPIISDELIVEEEEETIEIGYEIDASSNESDSTQTPEEVAETIKQISDFVEKNYPHDPLIENFPDHHDDKDLTQSTIALLDQEDQYQMELSKLTSDLKTTELKQAILQSKLTQNTTLQQNLNNTITDHKKQIQVNKNQLDELEREEAETKEKLNEVSIRQAQLSAIITKILNSITENNLSKESNLERKLKSLEINDGEIKNIEDQLAKLIQEHKSTKNSLKALQQTQ